MLASSFIIISNSNTQQFALTQTVQWSAPVSAASHQQSAIKTPHPHQHAPQSAAAARSRWFLRTSLCRKFPAAKVVGHPNLDARHTARMTEQLAGATCAINGLAALSNPQKMKGGSTMILRCRRSGNRALNTWEGEIETRTQKPVRSEQAGVWAGCDLPWLP